MPIMSQNRAHSTVRGVWLCSVLKPRRKSTRQSNRHNYWCVKRCLPASHVIWEVVYIYNWGHIYVQSLLCQQMSWKGGEGGSLLVERCQKKAWTCTVGCNIRISSQWKNMSITILFIILKNFWLFVCGRFVTMTSTEVVTHTLKEVQRDVGVARSAGGNEKEWPLSSKYVWVDICACHGQVTVLLQQAGGLLSLYEGSFF